MARISVHRYGLLRADYKRITETLPSVKEAVPMREFRYELRRDDRSADAKLVGCMEAYRSLNHLKLARGRWLAPRDRGKKVIVLADETASRLFPYQNPIGQRIWVGRELYTVIGQTKSRTASAAIGGSLDAREYNLDAYIPLDTMETRIGDRVMKRVGNSWQGEQVELSQITVGVDEIDHVDETAAIITNLLRNITSKKIMPLSCPKNYCLRQNALGLCSMCY